MLSGSSIATYGSMSDLYYADIFFNGYSRDLDVGRVERCERDNPKQKEERGVTPNSAAWIRPSHCASRKFCFTQGARGPEAQTETRWIGWNLTSLTLDIFRCGEP